MSAFWRGVVRFDRRKLEPWLALRNTAGMTVPLTAGAVLGHMPAAVAMAIGALNVGFSDSHEPYIRRARRMAAACGLVAVAVFAGAVGGGHAPVAVALAAVWAFAAGLLVALSGAAADVGLISLVTLLVFSAYPQPPAAAAVTAGLALAGGLLQTALALSFWPIRRYVPERRALAALYAELARTAAAPPVATEAPPASAESTAAQQALAAIGWDRSVETERYRLLLSQAERARLSLLALSRIRARLIRDSAAPEAVAAIGRYLETAARLLGAVSAGVEAGRAVDADPDALRELQVLADAVEGAARFQMDALTGQLRSTLTLAADATPEGLAAFARRETRRPWKLRLIGTVATLRANLSLESAACRHAVRLAACVALADTAGRAFGLVRPYWLPMTVAIVLKPDFTATFSRGVLRLAGTFVGLSLATGLVHALPASHAAQVTAAAVSMFVMRCFGPANYGLLAIAVSALLVMLLGLSGVPPAEVIAARAINTAAGGALALAAYAVWPTWERAHIHESLAAMLDAYREYFAAIRRGYAEPERSFAHRLDQARLAARLARSNTEASVERMAAEPGGPENGGALRGMLASAHRLVHAMMALEAGLGSSHPVPARTAWKPFADGVERTLAWLSHALRGGLLSRDGLPDLRAAHRALMESGDALTERYALVNLETDRVTNSLNTLVEEAVKWRRD